MPVTAGFRSGKFGGANINGIPIAITRWSVNPDAEDLDLSGSLSIPFTDGTSGLKHLTWEIEFNYFVTQQLFQSLYIGAFITNINLYIGAVADDVKWIIERGVILGATQESRVRGIVTATLRGKNAGNFFEPEN